MLDITQLIRSFSAQAATQTSGPGRLEVISSAESRLPYAAANTRPIMTWRVTRSCNLDCLHCLYDSGPRHYGPELTTSEGMALISDLAGMKAPRLLFAGGEPLLRTDLLDLVGYTHERGIQPCLLTNGTLLSPAMAAELKGAGLYSASILLEGLGREVDSHRRAPGAFAAVMAGYANCEAAGLPVELRIPLNRWNYPELAKILGFVEHRGIQRVVFAHLIYTGRGNKPQDDLTHDQKRRALDLILERAEDFHRRGVGTEISTDENHTDVVYLYLQLARKNPRVAAAAYRLLEASGAHERGAGVGLAGIDSAGGIHPDSYWDNSTLGYVQKVAFSEIWEKSSDPLLQGLRDRLPRLKGRCANCRWKQACGGNLRVRAEEFFGDPWMSDPACYLTNEEITKEVVDQVEAMEDNVLLAEQAA